MPLPEKLQNTKAILNIQTEATSVWDGRFVLPYFQHQVVKTQSDPVVVQQKTAWILQEYIFQHQ